MASRKVMIDVIVDDKGTTKRVAVSAKKLGIELEKVGATGGKGSKGVKDLTANAHSADRALKGASKQSSNATKNFSKLSQGIGGTLVPAYATLAASIFALSAAFRFLENAANLQNQIGAMEAFATTTGESMRTITQSVRTATGSLVGFQEAAQAAAIATASGFNKDQIVALAEGSKLAAIALGRDATDSFNRLIRGVTKAEPELLDELGIVLRLEDATRTYAQEIGKAANRLTTAERKTAVFNEVNRQLSTNFQAIAKNADELINPVTKLAKSFEDVVIEVQKLLVGPLSTLFGFISRNTDAVVALFSFFALSITKSAFPALANLNSELDKFAEKAYDSAAAAQTVAKGAATQAAATRKEYSTLSKARRSDLLAMLKKMQVDEKAFLKKKLVDQKRSVAQLINNERRRSAEQKKLTAQELEQFVAIHKEMDRIHAGFITRYTARWKAATASVNASLQLTRAASLNILANIGAQAARLAPIFRGVGIAINAAFAIFTAFFIIDFIIDLTLVTDDLKRSVESVTGALNDVETQAKDAMTIAAAYASTFQESLREIEDEQKRVNAELDYFANTAQNLITSDGLRRFKETLADIQLSDNIFYFFGENTRDPTRELVILESYSAVIANLGLTAEQQKGAFINLSNVITGVTRATEIAQKLTDKAYEGSHGFLSVEARRQLPGYQKDYEGVLNSILEAGKEAEKLLTDAFASLTAAGEDFGKQQVALKEIRDALNEVSEASVTMGTQVHDNVDNLVLPILDKAGAVIGTKLAPSYEEWINGIVELAQRSTAAGQAISGTQESIASWADLIKRSITPPTQLSQEINVLTQVLTDYDDQLQKSKETFKKSIQLQDALKSKGLNKQFVDTLEILGRNLLSKVKPGLVSTNEAIRAGIEAYQNYLKTIERVNDEADRQLALLQAQKESLSRINTFMSDQESQKLDILVKDQEILKKTREIEVKRMNIAALSAEEQLIELRKIAVLEAQRKILLEQKRTMELMVDAGFRLKKAMVEAFDTGLANEFAKVIKGEEKSIGKAFLRAIKGSLESGADVIAQVLASPFTNLLEKGMNSFTKLFGLEPEPTLEEKIDAWPEKVGTVLADGTELFARAFGEGSEGMYLAIVQAFKDAGIETFDRDLGQLSGSYRSANSPPGVQSSPLDVPVRPLGGEQGAAASSKKGFLATLFSPVVAIFKGIGGLFSTIFGLNKGLKSNPGIAVGTQVGQERGQSEESGIGPEVRGGISGSIVTIFAPGTPVWRRIQEIFLLPINVIKDIMAGLTELSDSIRNKTPDKNSLPEDYRITPKADKRTPIDHSAIIKTSSRSTAASDARMVALFDKALQSRGKQQSFRVDTADPEDVKAYADYLSQMQTAYENLIPIVESHYSANEGRFRILDQLNVAISDLKSKQNMVLLALKVGGEGEKGVIVNPNDINPITETTADSTMPKISELGSVFPFGLSKYSFSDSAIDEVEGKDTRLENMGRGPETIMGVLHRIELLLQSIDAKVGTGPGTHEGWDSGEVAGSLNKGFRTMKVGMPDSANEAAEGAGSEVTLNADEYVETTKTTFEQGASWLQTFASVPGAFGDIAGSLMQAFSSPQGLGGLFAGFFAANGGIAPGGFRSFATGGMVNRPTLGLVGEGRFNEAIVPLPDGKSIPVQMQNSGGDTNNVNLSLTFNDSGQVEREDSQSESERMAQFGNVMVSVVQREIANQKRPGGLLYRG